MSGAPFPAYGLNRPRWQDTRAETQAQFEYLQARERQFNRLAPGLDAGIRRAVRCLYMAGLETCQSCQSGAGHCYPEPTVEFIGGAEAGFKALSIALANGLKPVELRRVWSVQHGEPNGPHWALTFVPGRQLYDEAAPGARKRKRR